MEKRSEIFLPKARKADMVTRKIPGKLLVYDLKRHKAFCLKDTSAKIWRRCNGKRTVAELRAELEKDLTAPVAKSSVAGERAARALAKSGSGLGGDECVVQRCAAAAAAIRIRTQTHSPLREILRQRNPSGIAVGNG
jgi:Coenzyme PQQ synthesis protein D (PqqD)